MKQVFALAWLMIALAPYTASAQVQVRAPLGETASDYKFRLGPVGLAPTFTLENLGIDTNAALSAETPVRDFTFRATPGTAYLLPIRRLKVYGTTSVSFQYFQKLTNQRALDVVNQAAISLSGNRFVPRVFGSLGRRRDRPNAEIEAIVSHVDHGFGFGADYRFSPRFIAQVEDMQTRQDFEERLFRGALLNVQLNRRTDAVHAGARVALTPLTTMLVTVANDRERFDRSPDRDAESLSLTLGVQTKPSALIAGNASVGFRRFNALSGRVPDYRGPVADVSLSYTLLDRTRFSVTGRRGIEFSSEIVSPYYVTTGGGVVVTQMLGRGLDVQFGANGETLAYRSFLDSATAVPAARTDHVDALLGGFGFHVGDTGRVGLEIAHAVRRSPVKGVSYDGWRAGVKVTYGT